MLRRLIKNNYFFAKPVSFAVIFFLILTVLSSYAEPVNATFSEKIELSDPVTGEGKVVFTIETVRGENPKRISQSAQRVELWLGDRRLASLQNGDAAVEVVYGAKLFNFPEITLPQGYYFITIRCYGPAALFGRKKWHGKTVQIGIHPGKVSRIHQKINFFHW